jgi:hypothetical protein
VKDTEKYKGVFIMEDLTPIRYKLLDIARNQEDVKSAFTREGKIICFMKSGAKVTMIFFKIGFTDIDHLALGLSEL